MIAKVTIYSKSNCPYCDSAKAFFDSLKVPYNEVDITGNDNAYAELRKKTGHRTVPQIFIGDKFIGGYTDLMRAHSEGTLLPMLGLA